MNHMNIEFLIINYVYKQSTLKSFPQLKADSLTTYTYMAYYTSPKELITSTDQYGPSANNSSISYMV